ncbi:hypothetical protein CCZ01_07920 [Helicobacter monodelphidis]|nr:hypothetical protein CCZ01_07920 [Helicobacter sp. 15-1451]
MYFIIYFLVKNKKFEEYQAMKSKLKAVIQLSQVPEDTTGKDLELMTRSNLTFNEAMASRILKERIWQHLWKKMCF